MRAGVVQFLSHGEGRRPAARETHGPRRSAPAAGPHAAEGLRAFLREAGRLERFQREQPTPAFVPSDFPAAYAALRALEASGLAPGRYFCEWGSGFGVVSCLAALLGFDACGIEAEGALVEAAGRLAADFGLPVQFACGNFLPAETARAAASGEFAWLAAGGPSGYHAPGLDLEDFAVVYAYPWPDEDRLTATAFGATRAGGRAGDLPQR